MDLNAKYDGLFKAMPKAPLAEFLEKILEGLTPQQREKLIIEQVSYNRYSPTVETLEAFMCLAPMEENQWIWARVQKNSKDSSVSEKFFTSTARGKYELPTLLECMEYYRKAAEND